MGLYIIGDLHLSFGTNKPMHIFGEQWLNHHEKIKKDWVEKIKEEDLVILAGDTSWGTTLNDAFIDLKWIDDLPGKKLLLKGNHDYWWSTLKKMTGKFDSIDFLHNNAYVYGDKVIVGTRGWDIPDDNAGNDNDAKIFNRECIRLQISIDSAPPDKEKICVLHYPPFNESGNRTKLIEIIEENQIKKVYFGHIHSNYHSVKKGLIEGVNYRLISCDYIDFKLERID